MRKLIRVRNKGYVKEDRGWRGKEAQRKGLEEETRVR